MQRLRLSLTMAADWERIEAVRQAVSLGMTAVLDDTDLVERMAMVSAELLENAVKHGEPQLIGFCLEELDGRLVVSVRSALSQKRELSLLTERLRWIAAFPAPKEAYLAAMTEVYQHGEPTSGTLGLVRIAYEGSCQLECDSSEPGFVTVRALHADPAAAKGAA